MEKPKAKNGTPMCLRFYGTGVCFGNCGRSHSQLDQDEKNTWRKFLTHCRKNYEKWNGSNQGKEKDKGNEDSQDNTKKEAKMKKEPKEEKPDGKK